jgi:hypothetical protein
MNLNDATLHSKILADIEARIVSGEWPPGYRLPFEIDSRMTMNKVMLNKKFECTTSALTCSDKSEGWDDFRDASSLMPRINTIDLLET